MNREDFDDLLRPRPNRKRPAPAPAPPGPDPGESRHKSKVVRRNSDSIATNESHEQLTLALRTLEDKKEKFKADADLLKHKMQVQGIYMTIVDAIVSAKMLVNEDNQTPLGCTNINGFNINVPKVIDNYIFWYKMKKEDLKELGVDVDEKAESNPNLSEDDAAYAKEYMHKKNTLYKDITDPLEYLDELSIIIAWRRRGMRHPKEQELLEEELKGICAEIVRIKVLKDLARHCTLDGERIVLTQIVEKEKTFKFKLTDHVEKKITLKKHPAAYVNTCYITCINIYKKLQGFESGTEGADKVLEIVAAYLERRANAFRVTAEDAKRITLKIKERITTRVQSESQRSTGEEEV